MREKSVQTADTHQLALAVVANPIPFNVGTLIGSHAAVIPAQSGPCERATACQGMAHERVTAVVDCQSSETLGAKHLARRAEAIAKRVARERQAIAIRTQRDKERSVL